MADIEELIGLTMQSVAQHGKEEIIFKSTDGRTFKMYYDPDCCATCEIEDVCGDLRDLLGAPITQARESTNRDNPKDKNDDSFTWTFYRIGTERGLVVIRWYGSSNGYYSETASFTEITHDSKNSD